MPAKYFYNILTIRYSLINHRTALKLGSVLRLIIRDAILSVTTLKVELIDQNKTYIAILCASGL